MMRRTGLSAFALAMSDLGVVAFREAHPQALPALGLIGEAAIREAFAGDYIQLGETLRAALVKLFKLSDPNADAWVGVRALFDDNLVIERNGKLLRYPYTVDGLEVSFGEPVPVLASYIDAKAAPVPAREAQAAFLEAATAESGACRFRIRVIRAGASGNANYYPDAVLREAVPLFEGARVLVKSDEEHLAGKGKDPRNLIGRLSHVAFIEGASPDTGEIQADLEMIEPTGAVAVKLREAWDRGMASLFGFSIDAQAKARKVNRGGRALREAVAFTRVSSVDLIVEPGAGGEVITLLEAQSNQETDTMWRDQLLRMIEAHRPDLLKGKDVAQMSDADLETVLREAMSAATNPATGGVTAADLDATVRMIEARAEARAVIAESNLPDAAKARLKDRFANTETLTVEAVREAIKAEREYLASFAGGGTVRGLGDDVLRVHGGESRLEKTQQMLEAFFDPSHKDHAHARSFKECYVAMTGDTRVTGQMGACDESLMREALGTTALTNVLGDAIHRRMIADYRTPDVYSAWRQIVSVSNATDFRNQERARFGGYGDLPAVAQAADYTALDSPTDEKASYAVTKRGGLETLTIEAIKNDDVGLIRRIPTNLSRAAKRTLAKFVFDFIRTNPVIYDTKAFFHADHGNLLTTALASASYAAARLAMLKQPEQDSADPLGIGPKFLLVSPDLEETAADLFRRNTNQDKTFVQSLSPTIIPVWYWTDANDWAAMADPIDIPTIEIGFLDGTEEPELFVQDSPTAGSMFASDKMSWKIRHIYGGAVTDYRGAVKSVVA